jgi:hypothetical protein
MRKVARVFPPAPMSSDIRDVIYVNYLVKAERLEPLVAPPLAIQRLGPKGDEALFTFLTYRHGHFGPTCFGPLRSLWPSPIQSNWRVYVTNPATSTRGVHFTTTAITSLPHALAARLLTDGLPMHIPARAVLSRNQSELALSMEPRTGTAPDVSACLRPCATPELTGRWAACFGSWRGFLEYCVPQDRAMNISSGGTVTCQEIELGIPLDSCKPLAGEVASKAAAAIAGDESPLCFVVDRVAFKFLGEHADANVRSVAPTQPARAVAPTSSS